MSKFTDNIKKIARTSELEKKIKNPVAPVDRGEWEGGRGIITAPPVDVCPLFYSTRDNTYDIAAILAGTAGPSLADKCAKLDSITGLTDVDTSQATASFGAVVHLIVQLDGILD